MNFTSQPSNMVGANSPIIYQAYDSLYASAGFYYNFDVYVWQGSGSFPATPKVTITKFPDASASGRAWIDIHKIVLQYLSTEIYQAGTYQPTIGAGLVFIGVKVQGIYDSGSTSVVSSTIAMASNGYHYTSEGFNPYFAGDQIFTDQESLILTEDTQEALIYFDATYYTSINSGSTLIYPASPSSSSTYIQGVDIVQLMQSGGTWGTNGNISFNRSGGSDLLPVRFECQNKYGQIDIHFLNRFGTLESFTFNSLSRTTINRESDQYSRPAYRSSDLGAAWDYGLQISNRFNTSTTQQILIQSNWISESYVTTMEQIMQSDLILIVQGGEIYSALITDSQFMQKTASVDRLIQYGFTLEYSQPKINKIVR